MSELNVRNDVLTELPDRAVGEKRHATADRRRVPNPVVQLRARHDRISLDRRQRSRNGERERATVVRSWFAFWRGQKA